MRALVTALVTVTALAAPARADEIAAGAITKIEDKEIYVNLGAGRGVAAGAPLRIKRPVKLRHPVTKALIQDWVPIGSARITAVGRQLSMAVLGEDLVADVRVGDRAEIYVVGAEPAAPVAAPPATRPPDRPREKLPEVDAETAGVLELWASLSNQWLDARIAGWERYLAARPGSPYADAIREDIAALREARDATRAVDETFSSPAIEGIRHAPPTDADPGRPAQLAFLIDDADLLSSAWLHYRKRGDASYKRLLLRREGDLYLRGAIPGDIIRAPGVEYFVEIATTRGEVGSAVGSAERPISVDVDKDGIARAFGGGAGKSHVTLRASYLDFATFDDRAGDHTDFFSMLEADFSYQLGAWLHAVRSGFGAIHGKGGFADREYTEASPAPKAGFNYGYTEFELHVPRTPLGLALRGIAGVGQEGLGLGVEGRVRVGDPLSTNVSFGASTIDEIGFLSDLRLQVGTFHRAPLGFTVAVTDQPNQGDLGMLFAGDLGWRLLDWLTPTLRVSYQARTVVHSGVGAGLGLVFGW